MTKALQRLCSAALMPLLFGAAPSTAQENQTDQGEKYREDMHYVALLAGTLQLRSLESTIVNEEDDTVRIVSDSGRLTTGTLVVGGHLSELFHAEFRAGGGLKDARIRDDLTLSIDYFASWYIGIHYPLTDFANAYGQFGFSHISGSADLQNPDADRNSRYRDLQGDFPDSSFSVSWLAGLDLELFDNTYLVLEGGRLFKDTETDINAFQFSSGLRYEF